MGVVHEENFFLMRRKAVKRKEWMKKIASQKERMEGREKEKEGKVKVVRQVNRRSVVLREFFEG